MKICEIYSRTILSPLILLVLPFLIHEFRENSSKRQHQSYLFRWLNDTLLNRNFAWPGLVVRVVSKENGGQSSQGAIC